ncbi:MAG: Uma2 family endonuclease [Calditrichaeota bacterium]|nr:MAG: Uma2 family endonuclease [Calditrichota bacterium]
MSVIEIPRKPNSQIWTYEKYYKLKDENRYEVINGELRKMTPPAPSLFHQRQSRKLEFLLIKFTEENNLGEVFNAPIDVIFDVKTSLQPDLVFVAKENSEMLQKRGIFGSPDLIVEIISPSSLRMDKHTKFALYEKFKVKEYWLVDPKNEAIEVFSLEKNKYKLFSIACEKGKVNSKLLKGFEVEVTEIF